MDKLVSLGSKLPPVQQDIYRLLVKMFELTQTRPADATVAMQALIADVATFTNERRQ